MALVTRSKKTKNENGEEEDFKSPKKKEDTIMMKLTSPSTKVTNADSDNEIIDGTQSDISPDRSNSATLDAMEKK